MVKLRLPSRVPEVPRALSKRPASSGIKFIGTHWGFYQHEGTPETLRPLSSDGDPAGFAIGLAEDRLAACRILKPAVRRSFLQGQRGGSFQAEGGKCPRGAEPFVEVSWETALQLVADELTRVRARYGNRAMFSGSYGWSSAGRFHHAQSQLKRFFNGIGGSVRSVQTYSYAAGEVLLPHVIGSTDGMVGNHTPWGQIVGHAERILLFGGAPLRNAQVNSGGIRHHTTRTALLACRKAGAHFINISPVRADADAALEAEWIALRPGTDTALILALAFTLLAQDQHDQAFLDRYTVGFETLRAYLTGSVDGIAKNAEWAAEITGIAASVIRDLATTIATHKSFLMMSWALQRADHGEQPYWALISLAAMLGGIGLPGQGFGFGYASVGSIGHPKPLFSWPSLPQGKNLIEDVIPVARLTDMLLSPGAEYPYNGSRCFYPDIKLVYWAGGNPFHHHQDLNRLRQAWQRPETVIVHEAWWNSLARHADIVLPVTTFFERDDLIASGRDSFIAFSSHVAQAPSQTLSDYEILRRLAARLGSEEPFSEGLSEAEWLDRLYAEAQKTAAHHGIELPTEADFRAVGLLDFTAEAQETPLFAEFRADPDAHPLGTPSGRIELFSSRIASFNYKDCPGHAVWLEPKEWLGAKQAKRFPLHLLSCQPQDKLHSQWDHAAPARATKQGGCQPVHLHPADAAARGLANGDPVLLTNDRGACLGIAVLTEALRPGVVQMATGAWFSPSTPEALCSIEGNGNPNVLTPDHGTSQLAQGPCPNSCLVEISRFSGERPDVKIYWPPEFVRLDSSKDT